MFKLVRDKIPHMADQPERFTQLVLEQDEENIAVLLGEKLGEEIEEFLMELNDDFPLNAIEEACDVLEVMTAIISIGYGIKREHVLDVINHAVKVKYEARGGFQEQWIMNLDSKSVYKTSKS